MKKIFLFFGIVVLLSSCSIGIYNPNALNNYGTQTQVVLTGANYRIVRDVEVVISVNNINLKRRDVEESAWGELLRQYKLTGSQAFINVSIEEIRREKLTSMKQYVAARATIIEFLQSNGEPIKSVVTPYNAVQERANIVDENTDTIEKSTNVVVKKNNKKGQKKQEQANIVDENTDTIEESTNVVVKKITKKDKKKQEQANLAYLAYLYKKGLLNLNALGEAYGIDTLKKIGEMGRMSTTSDLENLMSGYDKSLENYSK